MAKYIERISTLENLMLAWRKLERAFNHGDVWFDELVITAFKLNLVDNLRVISEQLRNGSYQMKHIKPVPFPKGGKDHDGDFKVRQSFFIDFRDQLVWVAVFNVIGRTFDVMMPAWSYGNRQYVSMWKEVDGDEQFWVIGNHRNTTRHIYRKWTQSWPLMRKRITASLKKMARLGIDDFDDTDNKVNKDEEHLNDNQQFFKLNYLDKDYFPKMEEGRSIDVLYWTGIDLAHFYQEVNINKVRLKIESVLKTKQEFDGTFAKLLKTITHFEIDYSDYQYEGADNDLKAMQLNKGVLFEGLPTGLIVAGMLANIFMLDIDEQVSLRLETERDIIHFRYVDDHVIISTSEEKLFEWLAWYQQLLSQKGLELNVSKLAPDLLLEGLQKKDNEHDSLDNLIIEDHRDELIENIHEYACIDPKYPTPLMTQTLQKISMLQGFNLNMLSTREFGMVFGELQSLLVADLSEQEIKESTRISFACTMLTRLIVDGDVDYEKIHYFRCQWLKQVNEIKKNLLQELSDKSASKEYDTKEKIDRVVDACTNIIFNDAHIIDIDRFKKDYPSVKFADKWLVEINKELTKGQNTTKARERQVFNMLMYALDKVPDKVRIWIRAFNYCLRHEPAQVTKLYEKLDSFRDTKLHKLSVDFLIALLNTLCAENIIKATARLVLNDYKIPSDAGKDKAFIDNIRLIEHCDSMHFFVRDSQYMLSKAFAFFDIYAEKIGMKVYGNEESFFSPFSNYHDSNLDSTFWLLWAADLLKTRSQRNRPIFSRLLNNILEEVQVGSEYNKAFFFAYLRETSITSNTEMHLPKNLNYSAPWLNPAIKYTIMRMQNVVGLGKLLPDDDMELFKPNSTTERLNLIQWIESANSVPSGEKQFELINSELLSVLILLSTIKAIELQGENKDTIKLHPENFYLELGKLPSTWSALISMIENEEYLDIQYIPNPKLNCDAYNYPKILNSESPINASISYGLGVIFLQLLSKKTTLPWALNSEQVGFEWHIVLHELQGQGRISSLNYRILSACLSPRQRENIMLSQLLGDGYVREAFRDKPEIQNWMRLKEELIISSRQLRVNLVSVADEEHRQLTVIDLD
ncbi:MAG: hypothetical protein IJ835_05545 [Muribaculaceae bacterium]|nr:hypothetical protein [Muribaculaceae bacterium]